MRGVMRAQIGYRPQSHVIRSVSCTAGNRAVQGLVHLVMRVHQTGNLDALRGIDAFVGGQWRVNRWADGLDDAIAGEHVRIAQFAALVIEGGDGVSIFYE